MSSTDLGTDGLATFYGGADDDLISVPNNLLQGALTALTGEEVGSSVSWPIPAPADFNDAIIVAPTLALIAEGNTHAAVDLAGGAVDPCRSPTGSLVDSSCQRPRPAPNRPRTVRERSRRGIPNR
jgi:hypothetical protein